MADQAVHEFALTSSPSTGTEAKDALSHVLTGASAALLDRAILLISELLANEGDVGAIAVDDSLSVMVLSSARSVRVEIKDQGTGVVLGGLRKHRRPASHGWSPHLLSRTAIDGASCRGSTARGSDLPRGEP